MEISKLEIRLACSARESHLSNVDGCVVVPCRCQSVPWYSGRAAVSHAQVRISHGQADCLLRSAVRSVILCISHLWRGYRLEKAIIEVTPTNLLSSTFLPVIATYDLHL